MIISFIDVSVKCGYNNKKICEYKKENTYGYFKDLSPRLPQKPYDLS